MRIGIYVDVAKEQSPRGVGFHVLNLLRALADLDRDNEYLLYYQCGLLESASVFQNRPQQPNFRLRPVRAPRSWPGERPRLWWQYRLPLAIRRDRLDVFHSPNHFLPELSTPPTVVTIHDVAYFSMDHLYSAGVTEGLRVWTQRALERASAVIALSENTRQDLERLGVAPERIRVIYGGGNIVPEGAIQYERRDELRQRLGLPEQYILFVGTLHPRKNVPFLLRSFARLKKEMGLPHKLVLAGQRHAAADEIERLIGELGLSQDVIITGYVQDWEMPLLYKMADLFVLPTLYEGFTLVTLEAMAYGCPVISTDTSSIREGVGDAGILVPVNDDEALADAMRSVLTDPALRARLVERGLTQASRFTWSRCAQDTLAVYAALARARRNGRSDEVAGTGNRRQPDGSHVGQAI
ncbi:MAG TPA: glycosyltransferase family 1 protein [Gemmataceae bacterium]|nr:glycosyltransferase family 1 protein [Gemmataceae bacterium]